jgi:hypothetical protein
MDATVGSRRDVSGECLSGYVLQLIEMMELALRSAADLQARQMAIRLQPKQFVRQSIKGHELVNND